MAPESACRMGRKTMLVELVGRGVTVTEAAVMAGMVRQVAQKWLKRVRELGPEEGLKEQSRARKTQRRFEGPAIEELLEMRRLHPRWGPMHLLAQLAEKKPGLVLPAASTLTELMRTAGLLSKRRRQRRNKPVFHQRQAASPNEVWTIDFKGQFRLRNGKMCYPLTLRDAFSRKVLRIVALPNTRHPAVIEMLMSAFAEYGLPEMIHSDTGAPFGSTGFGRLSQISLFIMRMGIRHSFSRPAKPQDNGGHERMHLDLKCETAMPPANSMAGQQKRFDAFIECFNRLRMHQALGMKRPDSQWKKSPRRLRKSAPSTKYDASWETRRIDKSGKMTWGRNTIFVGSALRGADLGLEPLDDGLWRLHFASFPIGLLLQKLNETTLLDYLDDEPKPQDQRASRNTGPSLATLASANAPQPEGVRSKA
jgi:putative transposase